MELAKNRYIRIGAIVLVALAIGIWFQWGRTAPYSFPLAEGERVESWDYQGAYNNAELKIRAQTEMERLKGLFGQEGYTDYELYVSIANQYELMGDGKGTYDNLLKALAIDPETTGLAWHNMGKLMERFGAIKTARIAYDNMVRAQPSLQYQEVRLEFLKMRMPEDTEAVAQAEAQLNGTLGEFILE